MRAALTPILLAALLAGSPAALGDESHFGATCGLASHGEQHAPQQTGVMTGGPLVVTVDGRLAEATLRCSVQTDGDDPTQPDVASSGTVGVGLLVMQPTAVQFQVQPGRPVYVCTEVYVFGVGIVHFDNDPNLPGDQCRRTGRVDAGGTSYVDPSTLWGQYCVVVEVNGDDKSVCVG